ncbi:MAG: hypothetical protein R2705_20850 [Ilumatobacteraceae bacterium]
MSFEAERFNPEAVAAGRSTVVVDAIGTVVVAGREMGFIPGNVDSLLRSYLLLVRDLRRQRREPAILLRRDDVIALAVSVRMPAEDVLDRLARQMGATQQQRRALANAFTAGLLVLGLATASAVVGAESSAASLLTTPAPPHELVVFADHEDITVDELSGSVGAEMLDARSAAQDQTAAATSDGAAGAAGTAGTTARHQDPATRP